MDQELLSFALKSPPAIMLEAADHLLAAGNVQAAARLYQQGGKLGKAVEMAFAAGMVDVLDSITAGLDQDADTELVSRCVCVCVCSAQGPHLSACVPPGRLSLYTAAQQASCNLHELVENVTASSLRCYQVVDSLAGSIHGVGAALLESNLWPVCALLALVAACLHRCVDALLAAGCHEAAVRLLLKARQPERALDLLLQHEVPLTEDLAEALTPEKTPDNADSRSSVLLRIAQVGCSPSA